MDTIPCISLWQPWATLVAIGAKKIETRSWETLYRGPLAIHAATKWTSAMAEECCLQPFRKFLWPLILKSDQGPGYEQAFRRVLPFGAIVCVVRLDGCIRITEMTAAAIRENLPDEYAFGDYTPGRFMWATSRVQRLATPIPYKGRQGIFRIPRALVAAELAAMDAQGGGQARKGVAP